MKDRSTDTRYCVSNTIAALRALLITLDALDWQIEDAFLDARDRDNADRHIASLRSVAARDLAQLERRLLDRKER